jgi:hypothetical protein
MGLRISSSLSLYNARGTMTLIFLRKRGLGFYLLVEVNGLACGLKTLG